MNRFFEEKEISFLIAIVVLATLLPHPDNVTPIASLGLFAGTYIRKHIYLLTPVLISFLVDMSTLGFYNLLIQGFVYTGFLLSSISGRVILQDKPVLMRLPLGILVASLCFYAISNFAVWLSFYPQTIEGFITCYINAIPYLARSLLGNIIYSVMFFGSFELMLAWQRERNLAL